MKCTICGLPAVAGGMLCAPCKSALKRARYLSVQELPRNSILRPRRSKPRPSPPVDPAAKASAPPVNPAAKASAWPVGPAAQAPLVATHRSILRPLLAGAAALAVLGVIAYWGQPMLAEREAAAASALGAASAPALPAAPGILEANPTGATQPVAPREAPSSAAAPAITVASPSNATVAPPSAAPLPSAATVEKPLRKPTEPAVRSRTVPAARPDPAASLGAASLHETLPAIVEPVRAAPPPPAAAPVALPARPLDRWESMSNALTQCGREGGLSGIVCDQRVRLESCDGYWGKVAQCPLPPENPGGQ